MDLKSMFSREYAINLARTMAQVYPPFDQSAFVTAVFDDGWPERALKERGRHISTTLHRFLPALAARFGVRVAEIPVNDRPRKHGQSKYGLSRTIRVILDLFTVSFLLSYGARPMQLFGSLGLVSGGLGVIMGLYLVLLKVIHGYRYQIGDRPLLILAVVLIIIGVQFLMMGLLGEMVIRTYHEAQNKPIYYVRSIEHEEPASQNGMD